MRIYNYISKFTGLQYEIKNTPKGWMLSEWSHGGLMFASSKGECVERMNNYCDLHGQTLGDKYTSSEIRDLFGDKFSLKERPRKHRYIFFRGTKNRRAQLMSKLRYPVMTYPKKQESREAI